MIEWLDSVLKRLAGWLVGLDDVTSVENLDVRFGADWSREHPALVVFAILAVVACSVGFYVWRQPARRKAVRATLMVLRSAVLALLVLVLAEPVVTLKVTHSPKPLLVVLLDGTDSMAIRDRLSAEERGKLSESLGTPVEPGPGQEPPARSELVQQWLRDEDGATLSKLAERFRVRAYAMEGPGTVTQLELAEPNRDTPDANLLASQLKTPGNVTAIGSALADLSRRHRAHMLAGVVVVSDFDQNAGPPPATWAQRLQAPVYTVGLGPREVTDLSLDIQSPLLLKKDERAEITVHIRQSGLTGRPASVELLARRLDAEPGSPDASPRRVAPPKTVRIDGPRQSVPIPFEPDQTGKFLLTARIEPFEAEILQDNNSFQREVTVRDEFLKLLFVEFEPTWEWRAIKEVFYRDPLIGREGFRTFLYSSDFKVRRSNDVYQETLIRPRSEFFAYDVIILSDVPAEMLSSQFQEMLQEYVGTFGGGLVVLAGPTFGPGELADTRIAEMLPVVPDPRAEARDDAEFDLRLTPSAAGYDFMSLGEDPAENRRAWANMSSMPWYQPVARPHPLASVLAVHPTDRCVDGKTPQPLIAVRRYGKGEVIYFGANETWRLKRKYGEKYYRQLWGQMIYRLGLGRALGSQKRFQVTTDRPTYQAGDTVRLAVEAYDEDFQPLDAEKLAARLVPVDSAGVTGQAQPVSIPLARDKVIFETTVPVFDSGLHRLIVTDPVTDRDVEVSFKVEPVTAERRSAVRNFSLQQALANQTGGRAYELYETDTLAEDIPAPELQQVSQRHLPLWNTWLMLAACVGLMVIEWFLRKMTNLR